MASTVIPHFTRGGELITSGKTSVTTAVKLYTATQKCKIVIGCDNDISIDINKEAKNDNNCLFKLDGYYFIINRLNESWSGESKFTRALQHNPQALFSNVVSLELDAGDYISCCSNSTSARTVYYKVYEL